MNNECEIVKDLLPLYADDICSDSSKQLVEEHISTCTDCKQELEDYRYNIGDGYEKIDEKKIISDFSRKLKIRNLKKVIISVVLCLVIIAGSAYALLVPEFSVNYTEDLLTANTPVDGGLNVWVNLPNYKGMDWLFYYNENHEIDIYLSVKQNLLTKLFKDPDTSDHLFRTNGYTCASYQDGKFDNIHPMCTVKNIYYVDGDLSLYELERILIDPEHTPTDAAYESKIHHVWSGRVTQLDKIEEYLEQK